MMNTKQDPGNNDSLEHALAYARRGFSIFPVYGIAKGRCTCGKDECPNPGKHPHTKQGMKDASREEEIIRGWWGRWPDSNIGIATGATSGVIVLDLDDEAAAQFIEQFAARHGGLPPTLAARTGRGRHLYFACSRGGNLGNRAKLWGQAIDVRGEGGYVVAPPSRHRSGNDYAWEFGPDTPLLPIPEWLKEAISDRPSNGRAGRVEPAGMRMRPARLGKHPGSPEGCRHDELVHLVGRELARGRDPAAILPEALAWAGRCTPPHDERDVRRVIADLAARDREREIDWEPPISLETAPAPPEFPIDCLPEPFRGFASSLSIALQTPPDLAGTLVLGLLATCLAKKAEVQIEPDFRVPVNLYVAVGMASGSRKSPAFAEIMKPLRDRELELKRRFLAESTSDPLAAEVLEGRLSELKKRAIKSGANGFGDNLHAEAREIGRRLAEIRNRTPPRLITDDATIEMLAKLASQNDGRIASNSPEGGDMLAILCGRYSSTGSANVGFLCRAFDGEDHFVDRIGRESLHVHRPAVTIAMTIQPAVLAGLGSQDLLRDQGLLARFLMVLPRDLVGRRDICPPPVPDEAWAAYRAAVGDLLRLEDRRDDCGRVEPAALHLSEGARELHRDLRRKLEPRMGEDGDLIAIRDWAAKLAGTVARIAGLLHVASFAGEGEILEEAIAVPIEGETMASAIELGHYFLEHALIAFNLLGAEPGLRDARNILDWLLQQDRQAPISARSIHEGRKGLVRGMARVNRAIGILMRHCYLAREDGDPIRRRGRPPSPRYWINPHA